MSESQGGTPSAGGWYDWAAEYDGRTYYQRAGVCVTGRYLIAAGRRYHVGDLHGLWTTRSPRDPIAVGATIVAAVLTLAVVIGWPNNGRVSGWATVVAVLVVAIGAAVAISKVRCRHYELWTKYRGADVRLLDLTSGEVFWQICRALIRARAAYEATAEALERPTAPVPVVARSARATRQIPSARNARTVAPTPRMATATKPTAGTRSAPGGRQPAARPVTRVPS